ncbi:MAG: hypothetical protein CL908_26210 [Deltaproteobacteria bacterium]|nr:hypothetical protein [Deltaproteobacteria bacterium]
MGLAEDVLALVRAESGLKARDIGRRLGVDRREVNAVLYGELKGHVRQDETYGWSSLSGGSGSHSTGKPQPASEGSTTESASGSRRIAETVVGRLCRYYLECISLDDQFGVGIFASSKHNLDYTELAHHPAVSGDLEVLSDTEESRRLVGVASSPRSAKSIFLGHVIIAKKIRSRRGWEGFVLQPLFIHTLSTGPGENGSNLQNEDDLPVWNLEALRTITGQSGTAVMDELSALQQSLGLTGESSELPPYDELLLRLRNVRPDWPWVEVLEPYEPCRDGPLSRISEPGIYNRALLFVAERPPFTRGLEAELNSLCEHPAANLRGTALGSLVGVRADDERSPDRGTPPLEVLPLNQEQKSAVERSLRSPLTVITGPPGTGKSQVVSSILVNAAHQGQRVLFASKNNKAVDVVEARVNSLGPRPLLMRLGANAYQEKIVDFLTKILSVSCSEKDELAYDAQLRIHARIAERIEQLQSDVDSYAELLSALGDRARQIELERSVRGAETLERLQHLEDERLPKIASELRRSLNLLDPSPAGALKKLSTKLLGSRRIRKFEARVDSWRSELDELGVRLPSSFQIEEFSRWEDTADEIEDLAGAQHLLRGQDRDLSKFSSLTSLEELSRQDTELSEQIEEVSENLWRLWLVLQPARLTQEQRRLVGEYASTLRTLQEQARESGARATGFAKKYSDLFPQISEVLPCWAVTSLSVHRRVPLSPGFFDLVVIDEASQCDIASIVPLLYRARRAVVIGDPQQLRHISALRHDQNARLLEKHGLAEDHLLWDYVNSSLYDLGAPMAAAEDVVDLREHHRSHSDIIEFSNQAFYEGKLRVATRYSKLKPAPGEAAVRWVQASGRVERVASGGSRNRSEADAVVGELRRLLVEQEYDGTVGVISPFRAQANLIREMATSDPELGPLMPKSELLVDTVHRFQGDERDVMVFSPVVSEGIREGSIHFLRRSPNLFNVAITRARSALVVVGDKAAAESSGVDYLAAFARYVTDLSGAEERESISDDVGGPEYPAIARPELVSDWERRFYARMYESGLRPIPQYDVEKYTLDFALIDGERRLNIEVDGEHHRDWTGDLCRRDIMRNQRMIELGWDVIRLWVYELDSDMDECVQRIKEWEAGSAFPVV